MSDILDDLKMMADKIDSDLGTVGEESGEDSLSILLVRAIGEIRKLRRTSTTSIPTPIAVSDCTNEALRLAGEPFWTDDDCASAAAELRRLHALCEEMAGALESVDNDTQHGMFITGSTRAEVRAALTKWEESK